MNSTLKAPTIGGRVAAAQPAGRRAVRTCVASAAVPHVPERKWLHDVPESQFRNGKPDYTIVNTEYLARKTASWEPGSLGDVVESVVKTFEFEISHKTSADFVRSFAPGFKYSMNGGAEIDGAELLRRGSYNVLINDESYTSNNWDFEESHQEFKTAFPKGFAWECIEVLSGPPNVTFRWRHWGAMEGPYNGHAATGKTIEMYGMGVARLNNTLQIEKLEIYYDPTIFLGSLTSGGKCPLGFGGGGGGGSPSSSSSTPAAASASAAAAAGTPQKGGLFGGLLSFFTRP